MSYVQLFMNIFDYISIFPIIIHIVACKLMCPVGYAYGSLQVHISKFYIYSCLQVHMFN